MVWVNTNQEWKILNPPPCEITLSHASHKVRKKKVGANDQVGPVQRLGKERSCADGGILFYFSRIRWWICLIIKKKIWSIVDIQCSVRCRCTESGSATCIHNKYIHTHTFFFRFFPIVGNYKILNIVLCYTVCPGYFICFIYSSVCMLISSSWFIPLPPFPFGNHKIVFHVCESVLYISSFVSFFKDYICKWYGGSDGKESACNAGVWFLGWEDSLEEGIAPHCSMIAWEIPWTEKPGGLQSMRLQSGTWLSN